VLGSTEVSLDGDEGTAVVPHLLSLLIYMFFCKGVVKDAWVE
jgi:hypothetical protein